MQFRLFSIAMVAVAPTVAHAEAIHLVCLGAGSASRQAVTNAYGGNSNGGSAWAQVYTNRELGFEDQVNIEIVDGVGKIRMPRTMLPPVRGGKDGWMELENLKMGESEITANAAVNFINSPKVRIDRITGMLNISGKSGSFSAQCKPYDPNTVQRAF